MFSRLPLHVASKIQPNAVTGSWGWISARDGGGCGNIRVESRVGNAHRALYGLVSELPVRSRWLTVVTAPSGSPSAGSPLLAVGKRASRPANLATATTALQVRGVLAERVIVSTLLD